MIQQISLKGTLISLIESIDMFNYLLKNHHRRVAIISYNLGFHLGLSITELKNLVFAASLHDIGALTVVERDNLIKMDVENPRNHEIIGCAMLKSFKPFNSIANIIYHHHIKWSEIGIRYSSDEVDTVCFLLHLADRIDILIDPDKDILSQVPQIISTINSYSGNLFAPWSVKVFNEIAIQDTFWLDINYKSLEQILSQLISDELDLCIDETDLEELVFTFSRIVDFRSRFTVSHSLGVGDVAFELAKLAGIPHEKCHKIKIAGYLHDIGKIAIPTELIDKKGPLTYEEYEKVKMHSYYTYMILSKIKGLEDICDWASKHHEKYDGSGYPYHIIESMFSIEIDILAYADIFTSLCENRPYRQELQSRHVLSILKTYSEHQFSKKVFKLVKENFTSLNSIRALACENGSRFYDENIEDILL
jgi:HD-GYP domain-containing protein (c-di-GMP phosphodiesterase class II)